MQVMEVPLRGDRVSFRRGRTEIEGIVVEVEGWKDVLEGFQTDYAAKAWGKTQAARLGKQWQEIFWVATLEIKGGKQVRIDCLEAVENRG